MDNSSLIQNITNITQLSNITNSTIQMRIITVTPIPLATMENKSISINLSPTGTQQLVNYTNTTNTTYSSNNISTYTPNSTSTISIITPIYTPIPLVSPLASPIPTSNITSTERILMDDNIINLKSPHVIGIASGIILACILLGFIINYLCTKKKNINKNDDDKYVLPSMSYSPKSPNHVKVRNILYR